jgi:hypothetical protein
VLRFILNKIIFICISIFIREMCNCFSVECYKQNMFVGTDPIYPV